MRETALPSLGEKILRNIVRPSVLRLLFWENLFLRSCCLRSDDLLVSIRRILLHEKVFLSSLRRISCHFYEVCTIFYEKIFQSYMIFPIYFSFSAPRIIALITLLLCSHVHGKKNQTRKKRNKTKKKNLVDCQQLVQFIRDEIRWADDVVGCCLLLLFGGSYNPLPYCLIFIYCSCCCQWHPIEEELGGKKYLWWHLTKPSSGGIKYLWR